MPSSQWIFYLFTSVIIFVINKYSWFELKYGSQLVERIHWPIICWTKLFHWCTWTGKTSLLKVWYRSVGGFQMPYSMSTVPLLAGGRNVAGGSPIWTSSTVARYIWWRHFWQKFRCLHESSLRFFFFSFLFSLEGCPGSQALTTLRWRNE